MSTTRNAARTSPEKLLAAEKAAQRKAEAHQKAAERADRDALLTPKPIALPKAGETPTLAQLNAQARQIKAQMRDTTMKAVTAASRAVLTALSGVEPAESRIVKRAQARAKADAKAAATATPASGAE